MKGDRTLLNLAGFSAFSYSGLQLVSIVVLFFGLNLELVPVGVMTPDKVMKIYQSGSFGISVFIGLISFIFLFPALNGFYFYLKKENRNIVQVGFLFGLMAYSIYIVITFLQFGLVRWLAFQSHTTSFAMKNDVFIINQIIQFLIKPNLIFYVSFLVLWGLVFKKIENLRSWIVGVLLLFVACLDIFVELFAFLEFGKTAAIIMILKVLATSVAFILGGTIIIQIANDQKLESY
jgi:hypothetical protein